MLRGAAQFVAIALLLGFTTGCATTGTFGPRSRLWHGPVGWVQSGYDYARNKHVIVPNRYPSAVDLNGVHHVRDLERQMLKGSVLMMDSTGTPVLLPLVRYGDRLVADASTPLSTTIERDVYSNYIVTPRQDCGRYPKVLIPQFAVGRVLGPTFVYTENAWDTETYLYSARIDPYTHARSRMPIATWMTESCSGHMVLLPTGDADGFDFRWKHSGGENPPTLVPDIGAGVQAVAQNGFLVLLEKSLVVSRPPACRVFRPTW